MCKYAVFLVTLVVLVVYLPLRCYAYSRRFTVHTQNDEEEQS